MLTNKKKLILTVSLLLIIGFLATSFASYFVSRSSLLDQIDSTTLPLTSDTIYSEIQRDLLRPIFISSLMSTDTFLRDWVIEGEKDETQITRYLKEIQTKYKAITAFFVSEKTRIYYHADGILKRVSPEEERDTWYFRVREMEPDYEINVDPDLANKDEMTIFINYKVFDYEGNFIGTTGVGLTLYAVKDLIETYQEKYNRDVYFVNQNGDIVLHSSTLSTGADNLHNREGMASIADKILTSGKGNFNYLQKGKTIHLNTRFIPEFQYYLLVEQKEGETVRQVFKTLIINLILCALITTIVILLTNLTINTYQKRLEKMATTDKLTGIYNRQAFDILFKQSLKDIQRKGIPLSIIIFDIDHFKEINDKFGHLTGDIVIKQIADAAQGKIRSSDVLCRWGGEEFLIFLRDCALDDAFATAEKIRESIRENQLSFDSKEISVTVSFGIAQYHAPEDEDSLLRRADQALYEAKRAGRDRTVKEVPQPDKKTEEIV